MAKLKALYQKVVDFGKLIIRKRRVIERYAAQILVYALLITVSYVFLFPLIKMISLSFMSQTDLIDPEIDYIPKDFTFSNFRVSFIVLDAWNSLWNSFWFSGLLAVSQVIVSALTGFAFARYNFKFKRLLFILILISFIIPVPVMLIPRLMMFGNLQDFFRDFFANPDIRLIGTPTPQIIMAFLGQGVNSAILILIFFNFFRMIPTVLYEAAKIDGANAFQQFWHITIKISLSTIVVVFLFSFVWNWNETYITGLFYKDFQSLTAQLGRFDNGFRSAAPDSANQGGEARVTEAYKMAATLLSMIPLFVIYFIAQKQFVEGIEQTGITGE